MHIILGLCPAKKLYSSKHLTISKNKNIHRHVSSNFKMFSIPSLQFIIATLTWDLSLCFSWSYASQIILSSDMEPISYVSFHYNCNPLLELSSVPIGSMIIIYLLCIFRALFNRSRNLFEECKGHLILTQRMINQRALGPKAPRENWGH